MLHYYSSFETLSNHDNNRPWSASEIRIYNIILYVLACAFVDCLTETVYHYAWFFFSFSFHLLQVFSFVRPLLFLLVCIFARLNKWNRFLVRECACARVHVRLCVFVFTPPKKYNISYYHYYYQAYIVVLTTVVLSVAYGVGFCSDLKCCRWSGWWSAKT